MAQTGIAAQSGSLIGGHVALVACTIFYLAWWLIFFNPRAPKATGVLYGIGVGCIVVAAVVGIAGVVLAVRGIGGLAPSMTRGVPVLAIAAGGVLAYIALVFVTTRFFHRPVTTELILFTAWLTLELAVLDALYGAGALGALEAALLAVLVAVVMVGCLVCYIFYFNLAPFPSFIAGTIPLAAVGVTAAILATAIALA
ncbi:MULTISPECIES: hypothetical protein [Gordonibacter]|uniref:Yip1 domain-containing protein n=1 Tax=Gordonibacter faecis TaxID=3047475 RepID=A0ABT7DQJ8_9ACTN|nr:MULTISPECIES: hypothetical protein [unclassified Gordonibacter]MDJ1651822.1 hypothetical protein [Gordonibacter sp. KGMB12511]HIW75644.1 hypothetical protein [Candidatus Gordonibacter avicola]